MQQPSWLFKHHCNTKLHVFWYASKDRGHVMKIEEGFKREDVYKLMMDLKGKTPTEAAVWIHGINVN